MGRLGVLHYRTLYQYRLSVDETLLIVFMFKISDLVCFDSGSNILKDYSAQSCIDVIAFYELVPFWSVVFVRNRNS